MIVCPNCNHQNPESATQCEACYTPLPVTTNCPNCGATIQEDASFCGQCGLSLKPPTGQATIAVNPEANAFEEPVAPTAMNAPSPSASAPDLEPIPSAPPAVTPPPIPSSPIAAEAESETPAVPPSAPPPPPPAPAGNSSTQLQLEQASLFHIQTDSKIELPAQLSVIHIGKPGGAIPPDIDVSGFPDSSVVSRVHADIRVEGGIYYLEDMGSSNGTYVNHTPLLPGNRHRLRAGDRIALGKEDKVTFIFQLS